MREYLGYMPQSIVERRTLLDNVDVPNYSILGNSPDQIQYSTQQFQTKAETISYPLQVISHFGDPKQSW